MSTTPPSLCFDGKQKDRTNPQKRRESRANDEINSFIQKFITHQLSDRKCTPHKLQKCCRPTWGSHRPGEGELIEGVLVEDPRIRATCEAEAGG